MFLLFFYFLNTNTILFIILSVLNAYIFNAFRVEIFVDILYYKMHKTKYNQLKVSIFFCRYKYSKNKFMYGYEFYKLSILCPDKS